MNQIDIAHRAVGQDQPVLVIAEIGVNHDGSIDRALELVDLAAAAGADAIKLQIFRARSLMHPSCRLARYQEQNGVSGDPIEMLLKYELSFDDLTRIVRRARDLGLIPLATPFSVSDVETVGRLDLPAVKIASPDLVNRLLLDRALGLRKPLLISTGAATLEEITACAGWLKGQQASYALLHCISSYPTPPADAHLCWIGQLAARFDVPIGYSDHVIELMGGALAVAAGAAFVERHLTYDRSAAGPDHSASSDPAQFKQYVSMIRQAESMRGRGGKQVLECEGDVRSVSRQSLVLNRDFKRGQVIRLEDLIAQRPGSGLSAARVEWVIGQALTADAPAGTMLQEQMVAPAEN